MLGHTFSLQWLVLTTRPHILILLHLLSIGHQLYINCGHDYVGMHIMTIILGVIISVITCFILHRNDCFWRCFFHCFLKILFHLVILWILSVLKLDAVVTPAQTESCNDYISLFMIIVQVIVSATNIKYFYDKKNKVVRY